MKFTVAVILVVVAMVQAEVPRTALPRQVAAPYMARGWRPEGQPLFLPLRNQKQQAEVPPPQEARRPTEEFESTTTTTATKPRSKDDSSEEFTEQQSENVSAANQSKKSPGKPEKLELQPEQDVQQVQQVQPVMGQPQYYVVVPQGQNLMYSVPQNFVAVQMAAAPVQQQAARLQVVPQQVSSGVFTPFSSQFLQIYQ